MAEQLTYYEKRGRRYVPARERVDPDYRPLGEWIVVVSPGSVLWRRLDVGPARAALIAAAEAALPAMVERLTAASERRLTGGTLTAAQLKKWEAFTAACGGRSAWLEFASAHEVAEAGVAALVSAARLTADRPPPLVLPHAPDGAIPVLRVVADLDAEGRLCGFAFEPVAGADPAEAARAAYRVSETSSHHGEVNRE